MASLITGLNMNLNKEAKMRKKVLLIVLMPKFDSKTPFLVIWISVTLILWTFLFWKLELHSAKLYLIAP